MGFFQKKAGSNRWPGGVVPFLINPVFFPPGSGARQQVTLAINGWNTNSIIRLQPSNGTEPQTALFTNSPTKNACSSPIGMQTGGSQNIACVPGAGAGVIMHEIGHCLGLIHEHQRPDRDSFVTVNLGNVQIIPPNPTNPTGFNPTSNFSPKDISDCPIGPYDCGSIMHYGSTAFAISGTQTITVNNLAVCPIIGQRNALSASDIAAVRAMYETVTGLTNKVILSDTSDVNPALAFHDNRLFLGWKGSGNDNLSVMLSDDDGVSFHGKHISPETSSHAPALISHNGRLLIGWKGSGNNNLSIATVQLFGASSGNDGVEAISNKVILSDTSDSGPALCSHNGDLYIAWKGSGNDNLSLMVSTDNGSSFQAKHISAETSSHSPALASFDGQLYISWKGSGNENLNVATVNISGDPSAPQITGLVNKQIFADTSSLGPPSLVAQGGLLFLSWKGAGNDNLNLLFSADDRDCTTKFISPETSSDSPAITAAGGLLWIAWKGSGNDNLSVALASFSGRTGGDSLPVPTVVGRGNRNFTQSNFGTQGNFELLVPHGNMIRQYFRNNDDPTFPWHFLREFGYPVRANQLGPAPRSVTFIQSNFLGDGLHGNFEVIVRVAPAIATEPDHLDFFFLDSKTSRWNGPFPLSADGQPITGVTGA